MTLWWDAEKLTPFISYRKSKLRKCTCEVSELGLQRRYPYDIHIGLFVYKTLSKCNEIKEKYKYRPKSSIYATLFVEWQQCKQKKIIIHILIKQESCAIAKMTARCALNRSWAVAEIWPFKIIQDGGGRHLEFVRIENSAIRSAVPENPTLYIFIVECNAMVDVTLIRPLNKGQGHSFWYQSISHTTSYRLSIVTFALGRTV